MARGFRCTVRPQKRRHIISTFRVTLIESNSRTRMNICYLGCVFCIQEDLLVFFLPRRHTTFLSNLNVQMPSTRLLSPFGRSAAIHTVTNCTRPAVGRELYTVRKGWKTENEWTKRWSPESSASHEEKNRGLQPPAWNSSACLTRWSVLHQQTEADPRGYLIMINAR